MGCTRAGSSGTRSSSAARAWVTLALRVARGQEPLVAPPQVERDQSIASRAGSRDERGERGRRRCGRR